MELVLLLEGADALLPHAQEHLESKHYLYVCGVAGDPLK